MTPEIGWTTLLSRGASEITGSPADEVTAVQNVKLRLDAWRDAEHRRDCLAIGSSMWQEADEDVRRAATVFHAEEAQEYARYSEDAFEDRLGWSAQLDRRTCGTGRSVADAFLARTQR